MRLEVVVTYTFWLTVRNDVMHNYCVHIVLYIIYYIHKQLLHTK